MDLLTRVVPAGVEVAETFGDLRGPAGLPAEQRLVGTGGGARRWQSLVVRDLARQGLARLGHPTGPIARGRGGAPRFPAGTVGSLTHTAGYAGAAVALAADVRAIGVDVERVRPLTGRTHPFAGADENAELLRLERHRPDVPWAVVLFSAKEAAFKADHRLHGRWVAATDAVARIDPDGTFHVVAAPPAQPRREWRGRWVAHGGLVATCTALPARPRGEPR